ncbi:hypothetical protein AO1008_01909 [Aspergillus oryzae 100-8]|uniref:Uncharacterized protein n=1 Tax=Aspergillus oryzae (strain 3.042) TaxID=1160506 RepID=I8TYL7_ASPO3|nr:hypothetical protein Ao3042_04016 [Aspergillus oryzae 3.042]KDE76119.1 hypothetical protein AO1008_01909 [Aspergillus oryzae 100-8]|eukprot:EIT79550.1 hypothetical protein Ao3042_04016 [Aspergillus oryzae 3.042]
MASKPKSPSSLFTMPRLANLRTGSTDYEYGQLPYNHTPDGERMLLSITLYCPSKYVTTNVCSGDVANCKFPSIPKKMNEKWKRNAIWGIIGTAFFLIVSFTGVAIAFTVVFAVKSPNVGSYRSDSPEYALYKNTRFKECYSTTGSTTNCTAMRVALNSDTITGFGYLRSSKVLNEDKSNPNSDWCEAVSCFHDYKVIPSTPRDSAMWPTLLTSWATCAGFLVGSLIQLLLQQKALYSSRNKPCKGLGEVHWYSWLFIGYDLVSFLWWWVSFGKLAAAPASAATPFIVGWVIPWKYAGLFRYHPFSCAFGTNRRGKNVARGIFYILAVIQWIASWYVIHINLPSLTVPGPGWGLRAPDPSYDCVQSQIDAAPGTSTCSATQICSRNWLCVDLGFHLLYLNANPLIAIGLIFLALTLLALSPLAMMIFACFLRDKSPSLSPRSMLRWADPGPIAIISLLSVFEIITGCILVVDMVKRLNYTPDATVAFDWECQAIHVALSPWKYYIDLDYERGWRIAKLWFNS